MADEGEDWHGTLSGYAHHGCRCGGCRIAMIVYEDERYDPMKKLIEHRERLARGLAGGDPRHGTASAYKNWGCRCERCRAAHSADLRRRRQRSAAD